MGVTGGIAAYKSASLVRLFVEAGHDVRVVPTEAALRFVGLPTWEALSRNPVAASLYDSVSEVPHVALAQSADAIIVAPATAHSIAKFAHGLADDLLSNVVLTATVPLFLAPAMHTEMWLNPAVQANISLLRARNAIICGPSDGPLTGGDYGPGRMLEPNQIAERVEAYFSSIAATEAFDENSGESRPDLSGLRVLISAGGTQEQIDPVRYIGNYSSGKQAFALAEEALARRAEVTIVQGRVDVPPPLGVETVSVSSAQQMRQAMLALAPSYDIIIMAAAVADYRPLSPSSQKLKRVDLGDRISLELVQNPDILSELGAKKNPGQVLVAFAAESVNDAHTLEALGREKLVRKRADLIVCNPTVSRFGSVFGASQTEALLIAGAQPAVPITGTKRDLARAVLDRAIGVREQNRKDEA